jgi:hypothetical protein
MGARMARSAQFRNMAGVQLRSGLPVYGAAGSNNSMQCRCAAAQHEATFTAMATVFNEMLNADGSVRAPREKLHEWPIARRS